MQGRGLLRRGRGLQLQRSHLAAEILRATDGAAIDIILDMSAGAHIEDDIEVLSFGGRIIQLSGGTGKPLSIPLVKLMAKQGWITGALLRPTSLARKAAIARRLHEDIWPKLGIGVRPVIAHTFPLDQAAQAHAAMERGEHIGKIILTVASKKRRSAVARKAGSAARYGARPGAAYTLLKYNNLFVCSGEFSRRGLAPDLGRVPAVKKFHFCRGTNLLGRSSCSKEQVRAADAGGGRAAFVAEASSNNL